MSGLQGREHRSPRFGTMVLTLVVAFGIVTSASATQTLGYGSRAGMEVDIIATSGLDTEKAVIHLKHSRANAIAFCREYVGKVTPRCIREELAVPLKDTVSANCATRLFTTPNGGRFRFEGLSKAKIPIAKYRIVDVSTGVEADGTSASGYSTNMVIFRALCPHRAPPDE